MTWIDGAVLLIVVLSAAFSMVRGFVREVLGVGAWVGAGVRRGPVLSAAGAGNQQRAARRRFRRLCRDGGGFYRRADRA